MRVIAFIIAGALIGAGIAISHRYETVVFTTVTGHVGVWRTDNWTGRMIFCDQGQSGEACEPVKMPDGSH